VGHSSRVMRWFVKIPCTVLVELQYHFFAPFGIYHSMRFLSGRGVGNSILWVESGWLCSQRLRKVKLHFKRHEGQD